MKLRTICLAAALSMTAGASFAACPAPPASNEQTGSISKDGTHAPLETPDRTAAANPAQKDGHTMPMANQEGGGNKNLATSQQDVEAQQQGDDTAAVKAEETAKAEDCKP